MPHTWKNTCWKGICLLIGKQKINQKNGKKGRNKAKEKCSQRNSDIVKCIFCHMKDLSKQGRDPGIRKPFSHILIPISWEFKLSDLKQLIALSFIYMVNTLNQGA